MKQCMKCKELKDEEEFSWRWKELGIKDDYCKSCRKEYKKENNNQNGDLDNEDNQEIIKPLVESSNLSALTEILRKEVFCLKRWLSRIRRDCKSRRKF